MILIIEDDAAAGSAMERMLRYAGHEAVTAGALEALSLLHVRRPQLVIVDLNMPGMNGMQVIGAIRADKRCRDLPILMYTSEFAEARRKEALEMGANDFVVKGTLGTEALMVRVNSLITRGKVRLRLTREGG